MKNFMVLYRLSILLFFVYAASANAQFPKMELPGLGSKKSSDNEQTGEMSWSQLAENFTNARSQIAAELEVQAILSAEIAEALGLQSEASVMRAEAEKIKNKGDALGTSDLDEIGERSTRTNNLINNKLSNAEELSAEQKQILGNAAMKYVPSLVSTIQITSNIKDTISGVSELGRPSLSDGRKAIAAARTIPKVGPAIVKLTTSSVKQGTQLISLLNTKGVATPDMDELEFDM